MTLVPSPADVRRMNLRLPDRERCRRCGAALTSPRGPCPRCLLALALAAGGDTDEAAAQESATEIRKDEPRGTPPDRIGPYRIIETLGIGGMGIVYLAEQEIPVRRQVAVKLMRPELESRDVLARFQAERQALALMDHPGIAKVFDAGTSADGRPYFVMEWVAGLPITEHCDQKRLGSKGRLNLFAEVCDAIHHAHMKGILHRDIKPTNVLVTEAEGRPRPKVIDFGIAKALHQKLTERTYYTALGMLVGTPGYMSPEQASLNAAGVDTRTDVYSLGVLLYELLVGSPPFESRRLREMGWAEMLRVIQEEEPRRPSARVTSAARAGADVAGRRGTGAGRLARELRGDLDWIVLKALEKEPSRRYQSAHTLAEDVRRHLGDHPVTAGPPTLRYRIAKAARRHKVAFAVATALAVTLLASAIGSTALYLRAERARREARRDVVRLNVAKGMERVDAGDYARALPWLVAALRLEEDPERVAAHRIRIATTLEPLALLHRLWACGSPVEAMALSRDGAMVAGGSDDGRARVWSIATGQALTPWLRHEKTVWSVAFNPDGTRLVSGSEDGNVRVWQVPGGGLVRTLPLGGLVYKVAWSPDGRRIVGGSYQGRATVWDTASWRVIGSLAPPAALFDIAVAPVGGALATSWGDGYVRVAALDTMALRAPPLRHGSGVTSVRFSPDGTRVVSTTMKGLVQVWSVSGTPMTPPFGHQDTMAYGPQFSSDGRLVAAAFRDRRVEVWDAATGSLRMALRDLKGLPSPPAFSPDGQLLAVADAGGSSGVWSVRTGEPVVPPFRQSDCVTAVAFHPRGRFLVAAGMDGNVRIWDLAGSAPVRPLEPVKRARFERSNGRIIGAVQAAPDSSWYGRAWDPETGDPATPPLRHGTEVVVAASPDGRRLATGAERTARLWDAASGEPATRPLPHEDRARSVVFSPNGRLLATSPLRLGIGGHTRVFNVATGREAFSRAGNEGGGGAVLFTIDGTRLISGGDETIVVSDLSSGRPLRTLAVSDGALALALSPDGTHLIGSGGTRLSVWRLTEGRLVAQPAHSESAAIAFSPDGHLYASGGLAGDVQLWEVATNQRRSASMALGAIEAPPAFSPDGRWLAAASLDGTARVWDVSSAEPVSPIYRHSEPLYETTFSTDGTQLVAGRVRLLRPDPRPAEALEQLAQLQAGSRLSPGFGLEPLDGLELAHLWDALDGSHPEMLHASPAQVQAWHRERATDLAIEGRWREAAVEFGEAIASAPPQWRLLLNRGRALAEAGDAKGAAEDFSAALRRLPGELEPAYDLALLRLQSGDGRSFDETRRWIALTWGKSMNPDRARWAAHAFVLAPISNSAPRAQAVLWADAALEADMTVAPDGDVTPNALRLALRGAARLRAYRPREARVDLLNAVRISGGAAPPSALAFLALAERALGRAGEAQAWSQRATAELRRLEREPSRLAEIEILSGQSGQVGWEQRAELRVLLRELRASAEN
jgi:eukaryotic-like serine/threonine-protein kinase